MRPAVKKAAIAVAVLALAPRLGAQTPASSYSGHAAMSRLAASYDVTDDDIDGLRDQGWSWNEIGDALAVTKRSGRPLREIVADRDSGMSWSRIAEKYDFSFQEVSGEARRVSQRARKADARLRQELRSQPPPPENNAPGTINPPGLPPGLQQQPPSAGQTP